MSDFEDNENKSTETASFTQAKKRLASHPETSPETLDKLADKGSTEIQERVAENPHTSQSTLNKLASHDSAEVRTATAENPNLPPETIASLTIDEDPNVRFRLAENANTPLDTLEQLSEDDNAYVCERAKQTINSLAREKSLLERADESLIKGDFERAERNYRLLLLDLEPLIGATHPEMAVIRHKLAAVLKEQGKETEAEKEEESSVLLKKIHEDGMEF